MNEQKSLLKPLSHITSVTVFCLCNRRAETSCSYVRGNHNELTHAFTITLNHNYNYFHTNNQTDSNKRQHCLRPQRFLFSTTLQSNYHQKVASKYISAASRKRPRPDLLSQTNNVTFRKHEFILEHRCPFQIDSNSKRTGS